MRIAIRIISFLVLAVCVTIGLTFAGAHEIHKHNPHECKRMKGAHHCDHSKVNVQRIAQDNIDPVPDCSPGDCDAPPGCFCPDACGLDPSQVVRIWQRAKLLPTVNWAHVIWGE